MYVRRLFKGVAKKLYRYKETAEIRLEKFMSFLKSEVQNEERISVALSGFGECDVSKKVTKKDLHSKSVKSSVVPSASSLLTVNNKPQNLCIFCNDSRHSSADCYKARSMSLAERIDIVKGKKCCLICMKSNHLAKSCKYKQRCIICNKRHVILLCPNLMQQKSGITLNSNTKVANNDNVLANITSDRVLLPTLMVKIRGNGAEKIAKAVLDTGSQRSYILRGTAEEMNYSPIEKENIVHTLFGGNRSGICMHNKYKLYLASLSGDYLCNFDVLDQEKICEDLPHIKPSWSNDLNHLALSPNEVMCNSGPVEVLIGADVVGKLMTGKIKTLESGLTAMNTKLGWALMGKIPQLGPKISNAMLVTSMFVDSLNVSDLWKLDLIGISDPTEVKSKVQVQHDVDEFFNATLKVNAEGRYEVNLPWKVGHPPLPSNHAMAEKRLDSTLRKLQKGGMTSTYQQVFEEWMHEGIIEIVPEGEVPNIKHYLPHRPVIKEQSTTKVRPVFDASTRESECPSLNDCLEKGSNLMEQIPNLLFCFRLKQNGVVADIGKAFLQISVCPLDRNYLCFLWKYELGNTVVYRHKRVVFGVVCSPYQLNAVIQHHLSVAHDKYKRGESPYLESTTVSLKSSFYVDNFITSVDSQEALHVLVDEARRIMAEGKFDLRGWEFNVPNLDLDQCMTNVLGLVWNRKEDVLSVNCSLFRRIPDKVTKRTILSLSHSIFDPIGFTCPVTLEPKLLLRKLWDTKIGWDEEVTGEINRKFMRWLSDLAYLEDAKVKRWLLDGLKEGKMSAHIFCDASESSYAAAVFLRIESEDKVSVQLISAKTRVASVKRVTIPRLELLAALIGTRLYQSVATLLPSDCESYFWTDSTTVLAWIHRDEQWAPFVRNRVVEIRESTLSHHWNHVPGILNPADLPSRGCSAKHLVQSSWWEGPEWLKQGKEFWPVHDCQYDEVAIIGEKLKRTTAILIHHHPLQIGIILCKTLLVVGRRRAKDERS